MKINELKGAPKTQEGWAEYAKKSSQWRSAQPNDHKDPKKIAKAERRTDFEMKARHKAQGNIEEGGMGGINRAAPAYDVSYDKVLDDVYDAWKGQKVKVK